jgi:hypothetical protein
VHGVKGEKVEQYGWNRVENQHVPGRQKGLGTCFWQCNVERKRGQLQKDSRILNQPKAVARIEKAVNYILMALLSL